MGLLTIEFDPKIDQAHLFLEFDTTNTVPIVFGNMLGADRYKSIHFGRVFNTVNKLL